jgi:hypothetical protein
MKKVILFAAVVAAVSFASCGKKDQAQAGDSTKVDSTQVAPVDTTAKVDTAKVDTTAKTAEVKK